MLEFCECLIEESPARELVEALRVDIAAIYDGLDLDGPTMPRAGAAEFAPPLATFVVGFEDGAPVCCGGVKRLSEQICEIKKMFVVGAARGRGLAHALLVELESTARALGYSIVYLDTGPRQQRAQGMYERAGYTPIGSNYNDNPIATFFGQKRL